MSRDRGAPTQVRTEQSAAARLSIFVRSGDRFGGRPLHDEIIDRARAAGLGGATATRGMQGFGASARQQPAGPLRIGNSVPVLIEIVAAEARIRAFLATLDELIDTGLVILKPVTVSRRAADDVSDIAATATA